MLKAAKWLTAIVKLISSINMDNLLVVLNNGYDICVATYIHVYGRYHMHVLYGNGQVATYVYGSDYCLEYKGT